MKDKDAKEAATVKLTSPGDEVALFLDYLSNGKEAYGFLYSACSAIIWGLSQIESDVLDHKKMYEVLAANEYPFLTYLMLHMNTRIWRFQVQCRDRESAHVDYSLLNFQDIIDTIHNETSISRQVPADIFKALMVAKKQQHGVSSADDDNKEAKRKAADGGGGGGSGGRRNTAPAPTGLIQAWLKREDEQYSKFISKKGSAPKLHGTDPCLNKWILGNCKQGDSCPRAKSHAALKKTSDDYKKFDAWVKTCREGEE
jgi:hypothetical protein